MGNCIPDAVIDPTATQLCEPVHRRQLETFRLLNFDDDDPSILINSIHITPILTSQPT